MSPPLSFASHTHMYYKHIHAPPSSPQVTIVEAGAIRPLIFLARFPDTDIQRYAALAMAGLALGGHGNNKSRLVEEGSYRPLIDLIKFPDRDVQLSAVLAVASIVLGT